MKTAILLTTLLSALAFAASPTIETKNFDAKGITSVIVHNTSGLTTIVAAKGDKAVVTSTKNKFVDCTLSVETKNDQLIVKVEQEDGILKHSECDVDLDLQLPKTANLNLMAGSGDVKINGLESTLELKTGKGNVTAEGSFSNVNAMAGMGKIAIKGMKGPGDFKVGVGNIELTFTAPPKDGDLHIKTGSGDATVSFPKGTKLKTSFVAGSGDMTNQIGDTPNAKFTVSMKTGSGNLNLKSY